MGPVPPIGLAYVAAAARAAGHEVSVVDAAGVALEQHSDIVAPVGTLRRIGLTPDEVVERIPPDVGLVGLSNMFLHEWPEVAEIARLVRRRFPSVPIVVGGDNATSFWPWIQELCPEIDHCVFGEGERTIVAVADALDAGRSPQGIAGLGSREAPVGPGPPMLAPRIRDLGEIPRPAWDLFPVSNYLDLADQFGVHRGRSMPVLATRGCPYRCTFCSSPQMWTTRYSVRDPVDVVDEIEDLARRYRLANINFADLTAITKRSWTLEFCRELRSRGLDLTWQLPVGTRAEALDTEVLQALWASGCRNITYAPESGSARMLEVMDKRVDLDHILVSLQSANQLGFRTHVNVIIGHPAERWPDLKDTARLLLRTALIGCDTAAAIMFCPYPGSKDFDELIASDRLVMDESSFYLALSRGSSSHASFNSLIGPRALRAIQLALMVMFYGVGFLLRPWRLLRSALGQLTGREATHLDQFIRIKRQTRRRSGSRTARWRPRATRSSP